MMDSQEQLPEACQQAINRFEQAWLHQPVPVLGDYLPKDLSSEDRNRVLLLMVLIDLENRWKHFASDSSATITETLSGSTVVAGMPRCPLLEDYCRAFAELGSVERLPLTAILIEYRLRNSAGYSPSLREYQQRFPYLSVELSRELTVVPDEPRPSGSGVLTEPQPLPDGRGSNPLNEPGGSAADATEPILETHIERPSNPTETLSLQTIHPWKHASRKIPDSENRATESKAPYRTTISLRPRQVQFSEREPLTAWDYEIGKILGEGGMGSVFRARQGGIDRDVAVKMIKARTKSGSLGQGLVEKFLSEAVMTGALEHPNVIPIYDLGLTSRGEPFYAMKEVRGQVWSKTIDSVSEDDNLNTLLRVADAIGFAHARGVVHRDLKPDNVMLGEFGEVLVLDWGLAMPTPQFKNAEIAYAQGLAGTPAYMAPEMAVESSPNVGPWSDIYLLGALLFRCLAGKPPHTGRTVTECLKAAQRNELFATDRNDELMQIARKAMSSKPEDRYHSVGEFQQAIKDYRSHAESYRLTEFAQQELRAAEGIAHPVSDESHGSISRGALAPGLEGHLEQEPDASAFRLMAPEIPATPDYRRFEKAVLALEQAVELWDGNQSARDSLVTARLAYARTAFERHDYELAEQQLDLQQPTHAELLPRIRSAKHERDARVVRLRRLRNVAVGLSAAVLATVTIAAVWINQSRHQERLAKIEAVRRFQQSQEAIARITSISDQIRHLPRLQAVRKNLLEMVAGYYKELTDSPSLNPDMQLELARSLVRLGDVHRLLSEHRDAIKAWDQAMLFAKSLRASHLTTEAAALIRQAQLRSVSSLIAQHEFREAEHRLDVLIGELRRAGLTADREFAQTLVQRGMLAREQGQIDAAIKDLLEAEQIYDSLEGKEAEHRIDPRGVATTLSTLGQLFQQRGEFSLANQKIRQACGVWSWQVIGNPTDTEFREGYATSEMDLANTLRGTGHEESVEIMQSATKSFEELVRARPEIPHYEFNLATGRMNLASWLGRRGETEAAQELAVEAINSFIRLANEYPEDLRYPDREAEARLALAEILRDRSELDLAFGMLDEAMKHIEARQAKSTSPHYQEQAALAASLRAQLHALKEDAPAARESFQQAVAAWDRLIEQDIAQAARYRDSAAWTRFHFATHLAIVGEVAEATTQIDTAIRLRDQLPTNANWDENFAWLLLLNPDSAKRDSQRALTLAQRAVDAAADNPKLWRTLALAQLRNQRFDDCQQSLKRAQELRDDSTGETHFLESMLAKSKGADELAGTHLKQGFEQMQMTVPGSPRLKVLSAEATAALKTGAKD